MTRENVWIALLICLVSVPAWADEIGETTIRINYLDIPVGSTSYERDGRQDTYTFHIPFEFQVDTLAKTFLQKPEVKDFMGSSKIPPSELDAEKRVALYGDLENLIGGKWNHDDDVDRSFYKCKSYKLSYLDDSGTLQIMNAESEEVIIELTGIESVRCYLDWMAVTSRQGRKKNGHFFIDGALQSHISVDFKLQEHAYFSIHHTDDYQRYFTYISGTSGGMEKGITFLNKKAEILGTLFKKCGFYTIFNPSIYLSDGSRKGVAHGSITDIQQNILIRFEVMKDLACQESEELDDSVILAIVGGIFDVSDDLSKNFGKDLYSSPRDDFASDGTVLIGMQDKNIFAFLSEENIGLRTVSLSLDSEAPFKVQYDDETNRLRSFYLSLNEKIEVDHSKVEIKGCPGFKIGSADEYGRSFEIYSSELELLARFGVPIDLRCNADGHLAILADYFESPVLERKNGGTYVLVFDENGKILQTFHIEPELFRGDNQSLNYYFNAKTITYVFDGWWRVRANSTWNGYGKSLSVLLNEETGVKSPAGLPSKEVMPSEIIQSLAELPRLARESLVETYKDSGVDFSRSIDLTESYLDLIKGLPAENVGSVPQNTLAKVFQAGEPLGKDAHTRAFTRKVYCQSNDLTKVLNTSNSQALQNAIVSPELFADLSYDYLRMIWVKAAKNKRSWFGLESRKLKSRAFASTSLIAVKVDVFEEEIDPNTLDSLGMTTRTEYCSLRGPGGFL